MEGQSHTQNATTLDTNNDGWPEGAGMVEAPGLGAEKLDVAVYTIPPPVRLGPPDRRPILIATNYLLFRGQDTRGRNLPNSAGFVGCRAIGRTHPEHLQLRDNVRLDRAPAKALRTAGRPTDCGFSIRSVISGNLSRRESNWLIGVINVCTARTSATELRPFFLRTSGYSNLTSSL